MLIMEKWKKEEGKGIFKNHTRLKALLETLHMRHAGLKIKE